ncbi:sugar phosphate isomerase/epimerase [Fulvivirgaceae bacterium PWU4]|uniref:Sugar phosphate isomerase/epimerase n=1 Tax=Chryseosolibacter histidini TaxID=2782349 RepID=A0AAP2DS18_9BACT|nr:sugar phosphate isomerase/epimerase family protein [Chryseosolibacter histidini]MBT1700258.1 sugar phosphate isomerase/epimerase [Chryseosolibacter histidini]
MGHQVRRRTFLSVLAGVPLAASATPKPDAGQANHLPPGTQRLKSSLNAYSFNKPLMDGTMTIDDLLDFCATTGFDAVDITGYYFKGYPQVPADDYLFHVKRKAFSVGMEISGTGVRNDFTIADKDKRQQEVALVKKWVVAAAKLGAPVLRIFAGTQKNENYSKAQVTEWMLKDIETCVAFAREHGVIIGLQNHNDFIQTADEVNKIIESINSAWFGLILDTGSYRVHDPYDEIGKSVKHAVNWQIKEKIFVKGAEVETDIPRVMAIIKASAYNGYLPIETLGEGDPKVKVAALLGKLKRAMRE